MPKQALEGLKVLEYSQMVAGPYCSKLLADLGAEVIKIEEPPMGDAARRRGPYPGDIPNPEASGLFLYLNTNKLGITLNIATATGYRLFQELIRDADIFIEDCWPRQAKALRLDYESLRTINPKLIVTSITPFGQNGPYSDYKAHHLNLYHGSGHSSFFYTTEESAREPVKAGGYLGDYDAGLIAAVGTLSAALARRRTGQGQHIDVSRQEALVALERVDTARFANDPQPQSRPGMLGGLLRCKDGYITLTVNQDHQWQGLMQFMGNPEWSQREELRDELGRGQHRHEIQPHLEEWMLQHTRDEIYHGAQGHSAPVGPVRTAEEVMQWEQARQRDFFAEIQHPVAGTLPYPTAAYRMSKTPWQARRPAPLLGQHNEEIYCQRLGYSRQELVTMRATGII